MAKKWDFRDVSSGLQSLRQFLLGRKFVFHHRFLPVISPRSIPPPDVPRGPEYKYSDQYYGHRDLLNSVKPPVVAPVAEGFLSGGRGTKTCFPQKSGTGPSLKFPSGLPTPGCVWWFDAHCYFEDVGYQSVGLPPNVPCTPPPSSPAPCRGPPPKDEHPVETKDPCKPPCKLEPCKMEKPPPPPPEVCDPCRDEKPKKKC